MADLEIRILAGGLSKRMGRDKSRLRLGRQTILAIVHQTARQTKVPVRVIRKDAVPRCGPLGGIVTALKSSQSDRVLFLACDMPFVTVPLLNRLKKAGSRPTFAQSGRRVGFPFLLHKRDLETVRSQIEKGEFSLQALAKALSAKKIALSARRSNELKNINTPQEYKWARQRWRMLNKDS